MQLQKLKNIVWTDKYEVIRTDLGNTAGIYYDTYHKLFV